MKKYNHFRLLPLFLILLLAGSCEVLEEEGTIYGAWTCYENGPFGPSTFKVDISESPSIPNQVYITNFSQLGFDAEVRATVDGTDITIPQQSLTTGNTTFSISGSGYTVDRFKSMNWNYVIDGESYSANLSR